MVEEKRLMDRALRLGTVVGHRDFPRVPLSFYKKAGTLFALAASTAAFLGVLIILFGLFKFAFLWRRFV